MKTKIEWATDVWNPVTGCTKVSAGCAHCYAERMSKRLAGRCGYPADQPFRVTLHANKLDEPLHWKRPRRIFVCSMGDLFHKDVPGEFIKRVLNVMWGTPQHTYMVLTKRPERLQWFFGYNNKIPNLWIGVSVENQATANERIPWLLKIPAAVRFVSCEPLLGPVDLFAHTGEAEPIDPYPQKLDWVICGGETGPGARPMHPEWALSLRNQCVNANVPFFFKRWGDWEPVGKTVEGKGNYLAVGEGFRWGKTATGHLLSGREWRDIPNSGE
jgi:protein gp37